MADYWTALFLGLIEGLTEFLPVSSTAHLLMLTQLLDFQGPPGHSFEIFIQLGAILAVVVHYRAKLWTTAVSCHNNPQSQHFIAILIVGTIPALIAGFLLRDFIKEHLYTAPVIASALILGGFVMLAFERRLSRIEKITNVDDISLKTALLIGCCQMLALIPGVSRSAASIIGGLGLGLSRITAAEFSFFLAIPVMFAAVSYDIFKSWDYLISGDYIALMLTGFTAAFFTALVVIKMALGIINRYGFVPFAWYRIVIGFLIFAFAL
jgi:undecaprenyl-diphosphatase